MKTRYSLELIRGKEMLNVFMTRLSLKAEIKGKPSMLGHDDSKHQAAINSQPSKKLTLNMHL